MTFLSAAQTSCIRTIRPFHRHGKRVSVLRLLTNPPRRRHSSSEARCLPAAIVHLKERRLISLTGSDAPRLLQGLITNNVDHYQQNGDTGFYGAFLNAHGRILSDAFIYWTKGASGTAGDGRFLIEVDGQDASNLVKYLSLHRLRSKVDIDTSDDYQVWAAWLDHQDQISGPQSTAPHPNQSVIHLPDPRVNGFSHRFLLPQQHADPATVLSERFASLPMATPQEYKLRRYMYGIAEGHDEMAPGRGLPHEFNLDHTNAIDFKKGCYVGQELTIRTQHTGVVRKRVLPVQIYEAGGSTSIPAELAYDPWSVEAEGAGIPFGTKIKPADSVARGSGTGRWIAGVGNVGLAVCRMEMMTDVRVSADDGMSFTPDAQFDFVPWNSGSGTLRVRAFVPAWLRHGISGGEVSGTGLHGA
jgi:transferase CAF17, mitochondrial